MDRRSYRASGKTHRPLKWYYEHLFQAFGPQHWWPARTRLEVILGAILTQNTSWRNTEQALGVLRRRGWIQLDSLRQVSPRKLEEAIRSAGFYHQKAKTIRRFLMFVDSEYGGSLHKLFSRPTSELREKLLGIAGFGPETVDSVLVYAGRRTSFVVDAYARRILERHGLIPVKATYDQIQALFHRSLPADAPVFNEYHALIVKVGKNYCKRTAPDCTHCPLEPFLSPDSLLRPPIMSRSLVAARTGSTS